MLTKEELSYYKAGFTEAKSAGGCGAAVASNFILTRTIAPVVHKPQGYPGHAYYAAPDVFAVNAMSMTWDAWKKLEHADHIALLKKFVNRLDELGTCVFAGDNMSHADVHMKIDGQIRTGFWLMMLEQHQEELGIEMYRAGPAFLNRAHPNGCYLVYWTIFGPSSIPMMQKADMDPEAVGETKVLAPGHKPDTVLYMNAHYDNKDVNKKFDGNIAKIMPRKKAIGNRVWSAEDVKKILFPSKSKRA